MGRTLKINQSQKAVWVKLESPGLRFMCDEIQSGYDWVCVSLFLLSQQHKNPAAFKPQLHEDHFLVLGG